MFSAQGHNHNRQTVVIVEQISLPMELGRANCVLLCNSQKADHSFRVNTWLYQIISKSQVSETQSIHSQRFKKERGQMTADTGCELNIVHNTTVNI